MNIIIKPHLAKKSIVGTESMGRAMFPESTIKFEVPLVNGRYRIVKQGQGVDEEKYQKEYALLEEQLGIDFTSIEGKTFLKEFLIELDPEVTVFDLDNPKDRLSWNVIKANDGFGEIALSQEHIDASHMNSFKFVVYNKEDENKEKMTAQARKRNAFLKLSEFEENKTKVDTICKY